MKLSLRFLRHDGIYRSDGGEQQNQGNLNPRVGCRLPLVGPRASVKDATEGARLGSSSAMSSGRLFLDRVARQHCPSPLRRQGHHKTLDQRIRSKYHRTVRCGLSGCLTRGVHPRPQIPSLYQLTAFDTGPIRGRNGSDSHLSVHSNWSRGWHDRWSIVIASQIASAHHGNRAGYPEDQAGSQ